MNSCITFIQGPNLYSSPIICPFLKLVLKELEKCIEKLVKDNEINESIGIEVAVDRKDEDRCYEYRIDFCGKRTFIEYGLDAYDLIVDYGEETLPNIEKIYEIHKKCYEINKTCVVNYNFLKNLEDNEWI